MTLERRRPLPPGRYWADVFPQNRPAWSAWRDLQLAAGAARIETTSHEPSAAGAPEHDFVIWTTDRETIWPDDVLGFAPNVAESSITQSSDTVQLPDPESTTSLSDAIANNALKVGLIVGGSVVLGFVLVAVIRRRRN